MNVFYVFFTTDRCNTNLTRERGKVRAGTEPYEDCYINIIPPNGGKIVLLFHKFDVPGYNTTNGTCEGSYVEVLTGTKMVCQKETFLCNYQKRADSMVNAEIVALPLH